MLLLKLNEFLDFAGIERLLHPGVVIVGEHDSLGHACGSASIDESATIAWLNLIHPLLDNLIPDAELARRYLSPICKKSFHLMSRPP